MVHTCKNKQATHHLQPVPLLILNQFKPPTCSEDHHLCHASQPKLHTICNLCPADTNQIVCWSGELHVDR
jgi:hypothetical protein